MPKPPESEGKKSIEEETQDDITVAVTLCLVLCLAGASWFFFWIFDSSTALQNAILTTGLVGCLIAFARQQKHWKIDDIMNWCKENYATYLLATCAIALASFVFQYSLLLYPVLSRITFETHLRDWSKPLWLLLSATSSGLALYFSELSFSEVGQRIISCIGHHKKAMAKTALVYSLVASLAASIVPLDSYLLLGTPKVEVVEASHVKDGTVYISGSKFSLEADVTYQQTVRLRLPSMLLVDKVNYAVDSDTTSEPSISIPNEVSTQVVRDKWGRLTAIQFRINRNAKSDTNISISYISKLDVHSVADITFYPEIILKSFDNQSADAQQQFDIVNKSPYVLNFKQVDLQIPGISYSCPTWNLTKGSPSDSLCFSYSSPRKWLHLNGFLSPSGRLTAVIIYRNI